MSGQFAVISTKYSCDGIAKLHKLHCRLIKTLYLLNSSESGLSERDELSLIPVLVLRLSGMRFRMWCVLFRVSVNHLSVKLPSILHWSQQDQIQVNYKLTDRPEIRPGQMTIAKYSFVDRLEIRQWPCNKWPLPSVFAKWGVTYLRSTRKT